MELFEELLEQDALELPEVRRPDEVGRTDNTKYCYIGLINTKYCPWHPSISNFIKDCFILKGNIKDLVDGGSISLPDDSLKTPAHYVSIKENMPETDELQVPDDEEASK